MSKTRYQKELEAEREISRFNIGISLGMIGVILWIAIALTYL